MIIVCTSDIHGQTGLLEQIHKKYPYADLYVDAGDTERHDFEIEPFISVKGNCDMFIKEKFRIIDLDCLKIFVIHGDHIKTSKEALSQLAKKNNCNFLIHGHTHVPYYTKYDDVHILCPGSIAYPRSSHGATYGVIKLKNSDVEVEIVQVKS